MVTFEELWQKRYGRIIFDCDSTLTGLEGTDELARMVGVLDQVEEMTRAAMEGEIAYEDVFQRRLELIRPKHSHLERLGGQYIEHLVEDAAEVIKALHFLEREVFVVSGGYWSAIVRLTRHLGIPDQRLIANKLRFTADREFAGIDDSPTAYGGSKLQVVTGLAKGSPTAFVGDGATDLEVKRKVDLFVGYGGVTVRERVREEADVFLEQESLAPILAIAAAPSEENELRKAGFGWLLDKGRQAAFSRQSLCYPGK
jgi:phosphoserine phosphatase